MSQIKRRIVDWRKAVEDGGTAGTIWSGRGKGDHLKNQHQRIDPDKTAVAVGNQFGSAWIKMYKTHGVVLIKRGGKTIQKFRIAMPESPFEVIPAGEKAV